MAIIKCPECGHQTSDKAAICPSCGVEIAGKITKCVHCGEVYFKNDGLCPNCYRPYHAEDLYENDESPMPEEPRQEEGADQKVTSPADPQAGQPLDTDHDDKSTEVMDSQPADEHPDEEKTLASDTEQPAEDSTPEEEDITETEENDDDASGKYIDTDGENLEKPIHEDNEENGENVGKKGYIPVIVSLAITLLILAVCFYFYNDSKLSRETQAYETAMRSGDVNELNTFLRNFNDATDTHKQAVKDEITRLTKQKEDLSLGLVTREKAKLEQYLREYPDSPQKQHILAIIDSIDWEDALKTNTKAAFDSYIAAHSNGIFIKEAKEKVTVKVLAATAEDDAMAKSLFREFFLGINGNDASRITATLNDKITQFMGTENATSNDVTAWMKKQHGDDVSNVIWKLNHDYKITKREQGDKKEYVMDFTATQTIVKKDGRASSEHYKITSQVTDGKKIASMTMNKYTPQAQPAPVAKKENPTSSSTTASKPAQKAESNPAQKPAQKTESKPAQKPAQKTESKPAQKPAQKTESKPAQKPAQKAESKPEQKPAQKAESKPAQKTQAKTDAKPAQKSDKNN